MATASETPSDDSTDARFERGDELHAPNGNHFVITDVRDNGRGTIVKYSRGPHTFHCTVSRLEKRVGADDEDWDYIPDDTEHGLSDHAKRMLNTNN